MPIGPDTGFGRGCETEEPCGKVNVVEGQRGPWCSGSDVEHRMSQGSRMWMEWVEEGGGGSGDGTF